MDSNKTEFDIKENGSDRDQNVGFKSVEVYVATRVIFEISRSLSSISLFTLGTKSSLFLLPVE